MPDPARAVGYCREVLGVTEPGEAHDKSSNSPATGTKVFAKTKKAGLEQVPVVSNDPGDKTQVHK